ncbi:hypothetical protein HYQ46_000588 [Verticillium longisporum]|nr:hypothetical protein HYQ46_000588 [Verticillium longisporum]
MQSLEPYAFFEPVPQLCLFPAPHFLGIRTHAATSSPTRRPYVTLPVMSGFSKSVIGPSMGRSGSSIPQVSGGALLAWLLSSPPAPDCRLRFLRPFFFFPEPVLPVPDRGLEDTAALMLAKRSLT